MIKGVIVHIDGEKAVVMTNNGEFFEKNLKYQENVGDSIHMGISGGLKRLAAIACTLVLMLSLSAAFGLRSYMNAPVAYVVLDINPTVEAVLSRNNKLISLRPINEDAKTLLSDNMDEMKSKGNGLEKYLDIASDCGYIKRCMSTDEFEKSPNAIMITVASDDMALAEDLSRNIRERIANYLISRATFAYILTEVNESGSPFASISGGDECISSGKLRLIEAIGGNVEELKDRSIKELNGILIKKYKDMDVGKECAKYRDKLNALKAAHKDDIVMVDEEMRSEFKRRMAEFRAREEYRERFLEYYNNWYKEEDNAV